MKTRFAASDRRRQARRFAHRFLNLRGQGCQPDTLPKRALPGRSSAFSQLDQKIRINDW